MMEDSRIPAEQLDRYFAGEGSAEETALVQEWLAGHSGQLGQPATHNWQTGSEWKKISAAISGQNPRGAAKAAVLSAGNHKPWFNLLWIVPLIIVGAIQGRKALSDISGRVSTTRTYATGNAQRATITLPSGAQVTLAPASTLKISGNDVALSGEAVFTVIHKNDAPFTVRTSKANIRVLGTTFSVRSYDSDAEATVVVAEGKVAANKVVLSTGDVATLSGSSSKVQHGVDISTALSWTSGRLSFNEIEFARAIPDIERWYNVKIDVRNKDLLQRRITTSLRDGSLGEAKELLASALKSSVEQAGSTITFR